MIFIPWKIRHTFNLVFRILNYFFNIFVNFFSSKNVDICFLCGFHGESGGTQAISCLANMLAKKYDVFFVSKPTSNYNNYLSLKVKISNKIPKKSLLYIVDLSINPFILKKIKSDSNKIVVTIHGFRYSSHSLDQKHINTVLTYSDMIHFVSSVQQESYQLDAGRYIVIPNSCRQIDKKIFTNNIGSVGHLNLKMKGADQTIGVGLLSDAENIHLWFCDSVDDKSGRVICHSFEKNKSKIYNSFDVLVFMSENETFGLVVIEALSAGIPCVLPPLPAFEQFRECPGVVILPERDFQLGAQVVNSLLRDKKMLQPLIKKYFVSHYSEQAVMKQWLVLLQENFGMTPQR